MYPGGLSSVRQEPAAASTHRLQETLTDASTDRLPYAGIFQPGVKCPESIAGICDSIPAPIAWRLVLCAGAFNV